MYKWLPLGGGRALRQSWARFMQYDTSCSTEARFCRLHFVHGNSHRQMVRLVHVNRISMRARACSVLMVIDLPASLASNTNSMGVTHAQDQPRCEVAAAEQGALLPKWNYICDKVEITALMLS